MTEYTIATTEGADFAGLSETGQSAEVGDTVELEISKDQERAVVAAGWLEPVQKKEK